MRKTTSPSPSSPPRAPGISRYGRSGLDSQQFHTGPIAKTLVLKTNHPHRCKRCNHAPLIDARCPSCGYDHHSHQLARDHRHRHQRHLDDPREGLLAGGEDDDERGF